MRSPEANTVNHLENAKTDTQLNITDESLEDESTDDYSVYDSSDDILETTSENKRLKEENEFLRNMVIQLQRKRSTSAPPSQISSTLCSAINLLAAVIDNI
eukprot:TRINITY_DN12953_c0_g1_i1.p1 TRINITY_DN12953_c0_g1~~TRINITY_DN12953_c0_g1_i1.p1  ORF type:complete len:101 (+),score=18.82 TRINITY_DN12953_c0_g1_i1:47-349(+)